MITIITTILVFGVIIAVHEFGHFLAARKLGVVVDEFAIGFGPKLMWWKSGLTVYSIRLLPIGGFCKLAGSNPSEPIVHPEGSFLNKPVRHRMGIIAAGPAMNFVLAFLIFTIIFSVFGVVVPSTTKPQIGHVMRGEPAGQAGLKPGDLVLRINDKEINDWAEMVEVVQKNPGKQLNFLIQRGEEIVSVELTPAKAEGAAGTIGFIGVTPKTTIKRFGVLKSIYLGLTQTIGLTMLWFRTVVLMLLQQIEAHVAGPIGIGQMIGEAARMGWTQVLYLAAALSANIGMLNLLPIPALDGSRLVFLSIEGIRGKPVDPEKENFIHFIGFALLMLLAIIVTYKDILRLNT